MFTLFPCKQIFGMTASPTIECVEVLQCKAYVCEDNLIEEFQANAAWELLSYEVRPVEEASFPHERFCSLLVILCARPRKPAFPVKLFL